MDAEEALTLIDGLFKSETENEFMVGMADSVYITAQGNRDTCYILCPGAMILKTGDTLRVFDESRTLTEDVSIRLLRENGSK